MAIQTKQQKRAAFALKIISKYKGPKEMGGLSPKDFHDLTKILVSMPNMILSNGIGQTLAFLLAKQDKHKKTFDIIKKWIQKNDFNIEGEEDLDFLKSFSKIDQNKYFDVQNETLRLMEWLKRYARAFDDYKE